jgi:hypothetical protein
MLKLGLKKKLLCDKIQLNVRSSLQIKHRGTHKPDSKEMMFLIVNHNLYWMGTGIGCRPLLQSTHATYMMHRIHGITGGFSKLQLRDTDWAAGSDFFHASISLSRVPTHHPLHQHRPPVPSPSMHHRRLPLCTSTRAVLISHLSFSGCNSLP